MAGNERDLGSCWRPILDIYDNDVREVWLADTMTAEHPAYSFRVRSTAVHGDVEGLYIISVAARILDMHPQTLRKYERVGLVRPSRNKGMLRLYSDEDIARLRLIKHLVGDLGLNLAGVQLVLEVFNHLLQVRGRLTEAGTREQRRFLSESLDEIFELLHAHEA